MSIFKKHFVWSYPTCYQFHNYSFLVMSIVSVSWIILDVAFTFICDSNNSSNNSFCFWPSYGSFCALIATSAVFLIIYSVSFLVSIVAMISSEIFYFVLLLFLQSLLTLVQLVIFLFQDKLRQNVYLFSFLVFHILYLVNISCVAFNQYMLQWMNYPLHSYYSDKTFIAEPENDVSPVLHLNND